MAKVFVVHGHDEETKKTVTEFLTSLQLMPIILHPQANEGNTIIETFEKYTDVSFAIVSLTPDNVGDSKDNVLKLFDDKLQSIDQTMKLITSYLNHELTTFDYGETKKNIDSDLQKQTSEVIRKLKTRSRQNVIFELGYLFSKLGQKNVIALIKDNVEKPLDIDGIVYVKFDKDKAWQTILSRELIVAGMSVHGTGIIIMFKFLSIPVWTFTFSIS